MLFSLYRTKEREVPHPHFIHYSVTPISFTPNLLLKQQQCITFAKYDKVTIRCRHRKFLWRGTEVLPIGVYAKLLQHGISVGYVDHKPLGMPCVWGIVLLVPQIGHHT